MSSRTNTIRDRMRAGFSAAHLLAFMALFVALSGIAYAATAPRNSVKSSSIRNNQVKSIDVRNDSLTGDDINESSLTLPTTGGGGGSSTPSGPAGGDLAGTYPNPTIKNGAITGPEIANDAVVAGAIAANSVTTSKINDGAVTDTKLGSNAVTTGKIGDGAVTTGKIANGAVTSGKVESLTFANAAPFANGWATLGTATPQRAVSVQGMVILRGAVTGGTLGQSAFTLPAGLRPAVSRLFAVRCGAAPSLCEVGVNADGTVVPLGASNVGVYLDGILFQAEQ